LFDVVYKNSTSVVWEIEDKEFFKDLLRQKFFDSENVDLVSLK